MPDLPVFQQIFLSGKEPFLALANKGVAKKETSVPCPKRPKNFRLSIIENLI